MEEMIKRLEERKTALKTQAEKSEDLAEVKSITRQLATLNEDLAALRAAQTKTADNQNKAGDNGESERTKIINEYEKHPERFKRTSNQPPNFIQGKGFIPASESRDKTLDSALEQREKAGNDLKENRSVKLPLSVFGELRAVTVTPAQGQPATIVVPNTFSPTINPDFPVVSSLVDAVSHLSLDGGESFRGCW